MTGGPHWGLGLMPSADREWYSQAAGTVVATSPKNSR
jgi:hypothetical protein